MRHLILVSLGLITAAITAVHTKTDFASCFDAAAPMESGCCEMDIGDAKKAIMEECLEKFPNKNECDFETCYADKKGFLFSNGTVDYSVLQHLLEVDLAKYNNIMSILKQKCLNGDINDYGRPETCHLKNLGNCIRFHVLANCPKWSNELRCSKVKSASEKCSQVLA